MISGDTFSDWDAAYVLGALSAAERLEYEGHLATCPACRRAVAELAGLPGLLAQVPPGEVLAMDIAEDEPLRPPRSLMPSLATERRHRTSPGWQRWSLYAVPAAVAAALLIGGVGGYALNAVVPDEQAQVASQQTRKAFSPVVPSPLTAVLDVVPSTNGTMFRVECQYGLATKGATPADAWGEYAIYIVDRSGNAKLAKTWKANPDRVMRPSVTSPLPLAQIAAVEIRAVESGATLVRAELS